MSLGCVSTRMFNSWPACSIRFAKARGAASQPPGCCSLATANLPRIDVVARALANDLLGNVVLLLELAVGGVGQHVDADRQAAVDLLLHGRAIAGPLPAARQLPQAGQRRLRIAGRIAGGIDHARAAAVVDAQQQADLVRRDLLLGDPDRMRSVQRLEAILGLLEDQVHELAEALVEIAGAAVAVGEDEAAAVDVVAEVGGQSLAALRSSRGQGIAAAGEEQHGHLQEVVDRGLVRDRSPARSVPAATCDST